MIRCLFACCIGSPAWAIHLGDATLPEGTRVRSEHVTTLDLTLDVTLLGTHREREVIRRHEQTSELRVTDDGLQLTWSENRHRALEPGHQHDRVLPVVGHTYRMHDGEVSRTDGGVPTDEERAIVGQVQLPEQLKGIRSMLGTPSTGDVLPAGPMFAGVLDEAPGTPELVDGTLTLEGVREGDAHFAVELRLRSEDTDEKHTRIVTEAVATGRLVVDVATGRTERFALQGTVAVTADRPGLETRGQGTFTSITTLDFE